MRIITSLLVLLIGLSMMSSLSAQSEDEQKKKSSFELIAQLYGGNPPSSLDGLTSAFFFAPGTSGVFFNSRINPEVQLRYVQELVEDISVYGGLAYGVTLFTSTLAITSSRPATTAFPTFSVSNFPNVMHRIHYGSLHLGARYRVNIMKDDAFNFSLGGKGIFYPSQDLSVSQAGFSEGRGEDFVFNFEFMEDPTSKFVVGLELDINYQLGFKKSPVQLLFGITIDRVTTDVRELNSQIVFASETNDFRHSFGGGRVGVYIGVTYAL